MQRRWWVWGLVLMAGLSMAQLPANRAKQSLGKTEGKLNIIAWAGYIENGSSDKAYDGLPLSKKPPVVK